MHRNSFIRMCKLHGGEMYRGGLQSEIDRINEQIDLLKVGLSGIAKRYGYQTVKDFYRAYHTAKNAYEDYQEKVCSSTSELFLSIL